MATFSRTQQPRRDLMVPLRVSADAAAVIDDLCTPFRN
jgi:hypothetical protein